MANGPNTNATGAIVPISSITYSLPEPMKDGSTGEGVEFVRPELVAKFPHYTKVADACAGSEAVKARKEVYLPHPDPNDIYAKDRYNKYILRAIFYAVTRRTLNGLIGQVFLRDPLVKLPPSIAPMEKDADGSGLSLVQVAKKAEEYALSFGRVGLLADFPSMDRSISRAEILNGTIRPTLVIYDPRDVRNWRTVSFNGRQLLSLVVIAEQYVKEDDGFKAKYGIQFRVLKLTPVLLNRNGTTLKHQYSIEIWRKESDEGKYALFSTSYPRDNKGLNLEEIPFTFIGSEDNSPSVDYPPLYDLADINLSHYRNSADYEESLFMVGQPTPWVSGITESWAKDVLKGEIQIGSRAVIMLPENGACGLLQAEANGLAKEGMDGKERQMVALGAKLVENKEVQRTATEANQEEAAETSVLAAVTVNVANGIKWCLEWCAIFAGDVTANRDATSSAVEFKLNTEYDLSKLSPEDLKGVISAWQSGVLTDEEMRSILLKSGMATVEFKAWKAEADEKEQKAMDALIAQSELDAENNIKSGSTDGE